MYSEYDSDPSVIEIPVKPNYSASILSLQRIESGMEGNLPLFQPSNPIFPNEGRMPEKRGNSMASTGKNISMTTFPRMLIQRKDAEIEVRGRLPERTESL